MGKKQWLIPLVLGVSAMLSAQEPSFDLFESGNLGTVREEVQRLDSLESRNLRGMTPLMVAAKHNERVEVLNFLIESGADVHAQDNYGEARELLRRRVSN